MPGDIGFAKKVALRAGERNLCQMKRPVVDDVWLIIEDPGRMKTVGIQYHQDGAEEQQDEEIESAINLQWDT